MSIRSCSLLLSAALFFAASGCSPEPTNNVDGVTNGVNDNVVKPMSDDRRSEGDDLDVVVEKEVK